jgi:hypothetical protein
MMRERAHCLCFGVSPEGHRRCSLTGGAPVTYNSVAGSADPGYANDRPDHVGSILCFQVITH